MIKANTEVKSAGRGGLLALRPAFSYGFSSTHLEASFGGDWINPIATPSIVRQKPAAAGLSAA